MRPPPTSSAVARRFLTCPMLISFCRAWYSGRAVRSKYCAARARSVSARVQSDGRTHLRDRCHVYASDRRLYHILAAGSSFRNGLPSTSSAPALPTARAKLVDRTECVDLPAEHVLARERVGVGVLHEREVRDGREARREVGAVSVHEGDADDEVRVGGRRHGARKKKRQRRSLQRSTQAQTTAER
jgi:hypothetical protein